MVGRTGRIADDDVAEVRSRAKIEDIVGAAVALRNAGGGSLKGLCPFHDEKTPSFQVTPSKGLFYCFGCGEGGDVIAFLMKHDNITFVEAIEQLADRTGVVLRYIDGDGPRAEPGLRTKILEANQAAAEFFAGNLTGPDALEGRRFLDQRGFDRSAADHFGVGWAPRGGRDLGDRLRALGFDRSVLIKAGLVREAGWDFFQGRLLWPIRDAGHNVVGFGARRILEDDRMPAKYLNTPETPVYKKSQVLYGLDLARRAIGKKSQAVVVEGYTDVMAAHLSGIDTAVASCGTAFGEEHARTIQRLLGGDAFSGEIVFTFDGDAAGQAAAIKVFSFDRQFTTQTYVAVEPTGLDPCDLRLQQGEAAVRELVARRVPLYRFVMSNAISRFDLDRADGRLAALRAAAPLVGSIRDSSLVGAYVRELAGMIGMDVEEVRREVTRAARSGGQATGREPAPEPIARAASQTDLPWPDPHEGRLAVERGYIKLVVQRPDLLGTDWDGVSAEDFTHPAYRAVWAAAQEAAGQPFSGDWSRQIAETSESLTLRQLVVALAVEQFLHDPDRAYVAAYAAKLRLLSVTRAVADLKSRLQRTNPLTDQPAYNRMFVELLELEARRKELQQRTVGSLD
ncbi:DNA primase [Granulicoccus sp. GXG6511]|uniref:DNA primase n=1 Tax=Granulicoccus sp. GXG6511 TaxID=3381351 RepID=UPI003D7D0D43